MPLRRLGRHGLEVPALCLGTMTFGFQVDEAGSFAILDRAFEAGLCFLDSADAYPLGGSVETIGRTEEILGRWMKERGNREGVLLATKCFAPTRRGPNRYGLSRQHIEVPIDETLRAFDDLVRAGKVRYVGCSNYTAWRLGQALGAAQRLGVEGYVSVQPRYNLLYREIETELLPLCRDEGLGVLVYNPLAGGFLSGKYKKGEAPREGTRFTLGTAGERYRERYWQDAQFVAVEPLAKVAEARGLDLATLSIAWVLAQPGISSAIIGASRPEQLDASLAAQTLELDDDLLAACDSAWWSLPRRPVIDGYR